MYNVLTFLENSSLNYPDKTAVKDNNSEITYKELVINAKRIGTFYLNMTSGGNLLLYMAIKVSGCLPHSLGLYMQEGSMF